jgi:hypothetical protein
MITIDGKEYTEDQLTNEQKYVVSQIQDIETKLNGFRFQMDQLLVAKQTFSDMLVNSVSGESEDEQVAAEADRS